MAKCHRVKHIVTLHITHISLTYHYESLCVLNVSVSTKGRYQKAIGNHAVSKLIRSTAKRDPTPGKKAGASLQRKQTIGLSNILDIF